MSRLGLTLMGLGLCIMSACGGGKEATGCTEGQAIPCTCAGGLEGGQVCLADGTYGACNCSGPDGGEADAAAPDAPLWDAPIDALVCYAQDTSGLNCAANGGDDCVVYPLEPIMAVDGDTLVAADFSCAADVVSSAAAPIAVSGKILNFQDAVNVPNASVSVFTDFNFDGTPLATATSTASGDYSLTLPTGTPGRANWLVEHADALPTIGLWSRLDVAATTIADVTHESVSMLTANALPAFIGHARTPGLGVVVGRVVDCQGRRIMNAIGVVSSAASTGGAASAPIDGAEIYFFGDTGLPTRRNMRNSTNLDGRVVALEVPPATVVYLQAWGYLTAADVCTGPTALKLLSELASPSLGDTVVLGDFYPTEGPL